MPNMAAYGLAVPAFVLVTSSLHAAGRIPLAVLAVVGVFSVHITGGVVLVTFLLAWWLLDALRSPVSGRATDFATLATITVVAGIVLLPQFLGVLEEARIIAGHTFLTHQGRIRGLFDAVFQHSRHLNDFPIQNILIALAGAGFVLLLIKRIWWPAAVGCCWSWRSCIRRCRSAAHSGPLSAPTPISSTATRGDCPPWSPSC